jgi:hypothetical protein
MADTVAAGLAESYLNPVRMAAGLEQQTLLPLDLSKQTSTNISNNTNTQHT